MTIWRGSRAIGGDGVVLFARQPVGQASDRHGKNSALPLERQSVSPIRSTPRHEGSPRRLRRWAPRAALLLGLVIVTTGCQSNAFTRQGMLVPVTKQGQVIVAMWQGSWLAAWAVGIIVWGGILWAVIFHRKRGDQLPRQVRYNLPIEILYTVLPFVMVGVLFFFTAKNESYIGKNPRNPDVKIHVIGEQWSWQFIYPQYSTASGQFVKEVGAQWHPGLPSSQLPLLVIPANETVQFNLTSIDVIHAFWIVPFEFKRDVIPGYANRFTVTTVKTGTFIGHCSELCGVYHSRMLFRVKIVTPAQFRVWIHAQQAQQSSSGGA
jgi:cytochrome c oxidase subunit 2